MIVSVFIVTDILPLDTLFQDGGSDMDLSIFRFRCQNSQLDRVQRDPGISACKIADKIQCILIDAGMVHAHASLRIRKCRLYDLPDLR